MGPCARSWVVTFLLENRDAGASAGYVATGASTLLVHLIEQSWLR